ncbi:MAG: radical SAM protein [Actinomycetota bacterium]|nr:radical SAM protein [Actinomycetota bacterium]
MTSLPGSCTLCPRACGADRAHGQRGQCGAADELRVARAALHFWEEPPISGEAGSGAVFFSHCPLRCSYCQNIEISQDGVGKDIAVERLAEIFCELEDKGALNLNLVTPTHYRLQVTEALVLARQAGCTLPVVYNTSGYETVESIEALDGLVDIYLTDFKYSSPELAEALSDAPDYPEVASAALDAMFAQVGRYRLQDPDDPFSPLERGIIVRHLLLPGHLEDSREVVSHVQGRYGDGVCLSIMNQYTPRADRPAGEGLDRAVDETEYSALVDYALDLGVTNSFMQEGGTAEESFIPPFDNEGV